MALHSPTPRALSENPDETIRRLTAELHEAHEHQAATTELLLTINSSLGDLAPVFDAMLERALRLCEASFGILFIGDGERFRGVATRRGKRLRRQAAGGSKERRLWHISAMTV